MRSKTYEVNKICTTLVCFAHFACGEINPPPQFANWGTSFQKEAFFLTLCPLLVLDKNDLILFVLLMAWTV